MKQIPNGLWEFTKGINCVVVVVGGLFLLVWPIYGVGKMAGKLECEQPEHSTGLTNQK